MGKVDLKKLFEKVYEEDHHNLDLLIKIHLDRNLSYWDEDVKNMYQRVLYDCSWSAEEKVELLNKLHIPPYERKLKIYQSGEKEVYSSIEHMLMFKNESGLKALILMKLMEKNSDDLSGYFAMVLKYVNQRTLVHYQESISRNIVSIYGPKKELQKIEKINPAIHPGSFTHKDEVSYMKLVLSMIPKKTLRSIINDNVEILNSIIKTQNFKFIDEYINLYNKDISVFLPAAVETGNLDLVKHLISKGANLDYQYLAGTFNPVEMAVICNYNHILKYLIECGGSVDNKRNHNQLLSPTDMSYSLSKNRVCNGYNYECSYAYMRPCQGAVYGNYRTQYSSGISSKVSKNSAKRTEVIYSCFENSKNKLELDYTSILITSIFSIDNKYIKKYTDYILENNINVDLFKILDYVEVSNCADNEDKIQYIKDYILPCCTNASKKIAEYLNSIVSDWPKVSNEQDAALAIENNIHYIDTLLNSVLEEDKNDIVLLPYVRNIEDLKVFLKHGFDINQRDKNGNSILINLFIMHNVSYDYGDFSDDEYKLFKYLTNIDSKTNKPLSDITACNEEGFNALAMGIKFLHLYGEERLANIKNTNCRTKKEEALVKLVKMLPKECVDINSVHEMLNRRRQYPEVYPDGIRDGLVDKHGKFEEECLYQNHYHLFTELKRKMNFKKEFSQEIISKYFDRIKTIFGEFKNIDYEKTEEFLYLCIDYDTEIQHLSISSVFNELSNKAQNASYEEYLKLLQELSETARTLADFYEQHVSNKVAKDKYLEFVAKKYDTKYNVSQRYLMQFILYGIYKFGREKVDEILINCPQFNQNKIVSFYIPTNFASIYLSNFEYCDEDGYPHRIEKMVSPKIADKYFWSLCDNKTWMTGTLMSYAILINDMELVKKLKELGLDFYPECNDEVDIIWDYVTSNEMKEYLETKVGPQFFADLNDDEIAYITGNKPRSRK